MCVWKVNKKQKKLKNQYYIYWLRIGFKMAGEELSDKAEKPTSLIFFIEIDVTTVGGG